MKISKILFLCGVICLALCSSLISKSFWHPVAGKATFSFMASSLKKNVERSGEVEWGSKRTF